MPAREQSFRLPWADEGELIQALFAPLSRGAPGALGLIDDAALISPPDGHDLVLSTDGLIEGVHFLPGTDAADVGWKALAVNVSDIIAKGARPAFHLMNLALPGDVEKEWLRGFVSGLGGAQEAFGSVLIGGDTDRTQGPLQVSLTAIGFVPKGRMVQRRGASIGDEIFVCGTIGDAYAGLQLLQDEDLAQRWGLNESETQHLIAQQRRPVPPVQFVKAIQDHASAAMDISDGLVKDLSKLAQASGLGAEVTAGTVPVSHSVGKCLTNGHLGYGNIFSGGEDYTVLAAIPEARAEAFAAAASSVGQQLTRIGKMVGVENGVRILDDQGEALDLKHSGWDHLAG